MPFGLDTKSLIVGVAIGAFVVPAVMSAVQNRRTGATKNTV